ncbi:unnamed protein product [Adineta steineri]|uniref:PSP proline-rich domain-containing protein n=1 Tax=Adineta steineri TaxID=433720 RepID=A0A819F9S9_9BILA|nr:unnamed protein product [Adineta steineri]
MNDDGELPSIFNNTQTTDNPPLFTCSLKLDKHDYEKKMQLERTLRQFIEEVRLKRANLPPEVQTEIISKSAPLEYYDNYFVDRNGDELSSFNVGALQQGWLIPDYEQVYRIALPDSEQHASLQRARRPKPSCFNCGAQDHGVQGCPMKLDSERIRRSREQYQEQMADAFGYNDLSQINSGYGNSNEPASRYHEDSYQSSLNDQVIIEERFRRFAPGCVGYELRQALGLRDNQIPMYIYNMRRCGYPPGWLREARVKKSGLQVFHDNEEGEIIETKKSEPIDPTGQDNVFPGALLEDNVQTQADLNVEDSYEYDFDKVVSYPGFNVQLPDGFIDESYTCPTLPAFDKQQSKENLIEEMYLLKKPSLKRKSTLETYKPTPIEELNTPKQAKVSSLTNESNSSSIINENVQSSANYEQKSLGQISGTPLWMFSNAPKLNVTQQLPSRNQFQQGICDHLPFENLPSYQTEKVGRIFDLLKDVQKRLESLNNDPSSVSKADDSKNDNNMQMSPEHTPES